MRKETSYAAVDETYLDGRQRCHHRRVAGNGRYCGAGDRPPPATDPFVGRRSLGVDCWPVDRTLRLEVGSATIEGISGIAIVFILFTLTTQLAVALLAHQTAESVVVSAARSASFDLAPSVVRLESELKSSVPGARRVEAGIDPLGKVVRVWARFEFVPPGPLFRPLWLSVEAEVPVVVSP
jgi:hypothetical protein